MSVTSNKIDFKILVRQVQVMFSKEYPDEHVLLEEAQGVVKGLYLSLQRAILRAAKEKARVSFEPFTVLETVDRFTSKWMSRPEIIQRIVDVSGLDAKLAGSGLSFVEEIVDRELGESQQHILLKEFGELDGTRHPVYRLVLNGDKAVKFVIRGRGA